MKGDWRSRSVVASGAKGCRCSRYNPPPTLCDVINGKTGQHRSRCRSMPTNSGDVKSVVDRRVSCAAAGAGEGVSWARANSGIDNASNRWTTAASLTRERKKGTSGEMQNDAAWYPLIKNGLIQFELIGSYSLFRKFLKQALMDRSRMLMRTYIFILVNETDLCKNLFCALKYQYIYILCLF